MQKYNANLVEKNKNLEAKKQEKLQSLADRKQQQANEEQKQEEAMEVDQELRPDPSAQEAKEQTCSFKNGGYNPEEDKVAEKQKADEEEEKVTTVEPAKSSSYQKKPEKGVKIAVGNL